MLDAILHALSHPIRREILWLVWERSLPAGDLASRFSVSAPTISSHLKVMREAGLVAMTRDANRRIYRARPEVLNTLQQQLFSTEASPDLAIRARALTASPSAALSRPAFEIASDLLVPIEPHAAWAMWTDPKQMGWAGADPTAEPVPGGIFGFTSSFGIRVRGIFGAMAPPTFLTFRWDFSGEDIPMPPAENTTTLMFQPEEGGTRVTMRQIVFDENIVLFLEAGWTDTFQRLARCFS